MRFYTLRKMRFRNISKCVFVVNLCSFVELPQKMPRPQYPGSQWFSGFSLCVVETCGSHFSI